jgi:acyl carrier protein
MADTTTPELQILSLVTDDMQLPVPDVATDLIDEGILDSLVFVDLIARLEETFGFEIDLSELEIDEFRSVRQIAVYVQAQAGTVNATTTTDSQSVASQPGALVTH